MTTLCKYLFVCVIQNILIICFYKNGKTNMISCRDIIMGYATSDN